MQLAGTLKRGLTGPVRIGLSASQLTLELALGAVRVARGLLVPDRGSQGGIDTWAIPERPVPSAARSRSTSGRAAPKPPASRPEPPTVPPASVVGPAVPAVPPSAAAKQVDDEPVPVAEFGEAGAEEGAGAEVEVSAPWDGYDGMTAAQVKAVLADSDREVLAAVALYEGSRRGRRSVMAAAERRLRILSSPSGR